VKKTALWIFVFIPFIIIFQCNQPPVHLNKSLSVEERIDVLLSKITLEEKISFGKLLPNRGSFKCDLESGQQQEVTLKLDWGAFAFYDIETSIWKAEAGLFEILIGSSSRDIQPSGKIELK